MDQNRADAYETAEGALRDLRAVLEDHTRRLTMGDAGQSLTFPQHVYGVDPLIEAMLAHVRQSTVAATARARARAVQAGSLTPLAPQGNTLISLSGESGSGKSSIMRRLTEVLRERMPELGEEPLFAKYEQFQRDTPFLGLQVESLASRGGARANRW